MNDLQIQQYKEKVAKSLVRDGYYTNLKEAMTSVEGMLKINKLNNPMVGKHEKGKRSERTNDAQN